MENGVMHMGQSPPGFLEICYWGVCYWGCERQMIAFISKQLVLAVSAMSCTRPEITFVNVTIG